MPEITYHYCIVRKDLPIGDILAQLVHASGESASIFGTVLPDNTHAVVLAARDEQELLNIESKLICHGISIRPIREPDMNNTLTAIGICPGPRGKIRKILANYPLFKENK